MSSWLTSWPLTYKPRPTLVSTRPSVPTALRGPPAGSPRLLQGGAAARAVVNAKVRRGGDLRPKRSANASAAEGEQGHARSGIGEEALYVDVLKGGSSSSDLVQLRAAGLLAPELPLLPADGAATASPLLQPQVTLEALFESLCADGGCEHLEPADRAHLLAALEVLLSKAPLAVRALQFAAGGASASRPLPNVSVEEATRGTVELLPSAARNGNWLANHEDFQRKRPSNESAVVVSAALETACELLALRLDAATVAAALLSEVLTDRTPTWPSPGSGPPDAFRLEVTELLEQMRAMRSLSASMPHLGDANAAAVRRALMTAVQDEQADPRSLLVLLGSALTRLRAAELWQPTDQLALALEAIQLYVPLAYSVGFGPAFSELEALAYQRMFPEQLRRLERWFCVVWPDAEQVAEELRARLEGLLRFEPTLSTLLERVEVTARVKSVRSTFRKLLRQRTKIDRVKDIVGLRVVLTPAADSAQELGALMGRPLIEAEADRLLCHGAYREVLRLSAEIPGRFRDFVTRPKANGYQSIHTNLQLPGGRVVEVQIRTAAMHECATSGSAAHMGYRAVQLGGGVSEPGDDIALQPLLPATLGTAPTVETENVSGRAV